MYKTIYFVVFIFLSNLLEAYDKKIILVSFSIEKKAEVMFEKLPENNPELYKLSKKHNLDIKMRKSGDYYVIVVEIFKDKKVLRSVLKRLRKKFDGAYATNYVYPTVDESQEVDLKTISISIPLKINQINEQNNSMYQKLKNYLLKEKQKIEDYFNNTLFQKYFEWKYIILIFCLSLLIHYYIKFKRIYDSY